jgi:hypothetical protein
LAALAWRRSKVVVIDDNSGQVMAVESSTACADILMSCFYFVV